MKKLLIILSLTFALAGCGSGISQSDYDAIATEKTELAAQIDELSSQSEELSGKIQELIDQITALTAENETLKTANATLTEENKKLQAQIDASAVSASSSSVASSSSASTASAATSDTKTGSYIGNRNSNKFHRSSCSTLPAESNRIYFSTRDEAINAGMVPCKRCNP